MNKHIFLVGIMGMLAQSALAQHAPAPEADSTAVNGPDTLATMPDQSLEGGAGRHTYARYHSYARCHERQYHQRIGALQGRLLQPR